VPIIAAISRINRFLVPSIWFIYSSQEFNLSIVEALSFRRTRSFVHISLQTSSVRHRCIAHIKHYPFSSFVFYPSSTRTTMHLSSILVGLVGLLVSASAKPANGIVYKHFDCGVDISHASEHFNKTVRLMHQGVFKVHSGTQMAGVAVRAAKPLITVDVAFHIITTAAKAGTITQKMADDQLTILNKAYAASNIQFNRIATTFTVNDAWAIGADADATAMKTALRNGTYATHNIYFMTDLTGSILGTCSLPSDIGPSTSAPSTYNSDGCMIQANTMPGGNIYGFNLGMTTVHETGHWMGLLHTFEGYSCTGNGDFVSDTPMQSSSTDGCPAKPPKDSCPGAAGVDPIHNYMDYSDDSCYTGFTGGQTKRMANMWATYRQGR
jgi:hypothetical protein